MMAELCNPAVVGANVIPNFRERFPAIVALEGPTVNAGFVETTEPIVRVLFAVLVTVTLSVWDVPTATYPSVSVDGETVKFPLARSSAGG